jgi:hypothetical protein
VEAGQPRHPDLKPEDLAMPFFDSYSRTSPGTIPGIVEHKAADGTSEKRVEPVKQRTDIQAAFFEMWLQEDLWRHEQDPAHRSPAGAAGPPAGAAGGPVAGPGISRPHTEQNPGVSDWRC